MKTISCIYEDIELSHFINNNIDKDSSTLLLQIFSGIANFEYLDNLRKEILTLLPQIKIIGASSDGEIINANVTASKTILSFSQFDSTIIQTYEVVGISNSYQMGVDIMTQAKQAHDAKLLISFADGLHVNAEEYLQGIRSQNRDIVIAGGLAGDNATFSATYVMSERGVYLDSAVMALFYNPNLQIHTQYSFDWDKIGKSLTITKSDKNRVYTIDNIAAAKVYGKYLGQEVEDRLPDMGIEFPLVLNKGGVCVARAVLQKHDDDSLTFAGNLTEGDRVQFGYGNVNNILANSHSTAHELLKHPIESIFIYSCMARKHLLEENIVQEIIPLNHIAPTSGFFTNGEFFCSINKDVNLLNESMTILAISESTTITKASIESSYNSKNNSTLKALSHLISVTNDELSSMTLNLEKSVQEKTKDINTKNKKLNKLLDILDRNIILSRTDLRGVITHVSQAFCDIGGYTEEELLGKPHNMVRHPDMPAFAFKEMWSALKQDACWKGEVKNLRKDGSYYWVDAHIEPDYDDDGNKIGYFATRHDISAHKEVEDLSLEIEETQREVVFCMGAIGESRSKETGNHVKRVAEYSYLLAKASGLGEGESLLLKQASPMHDIGKVAIADSILKKPGRLTDEEMTIMKTHSEIGYDMLKHSSRPLLQAAAIVAYEHHEHYNGKGYPRGLKEGNIHIYGRITAIADVFDALGSDRCYKEAWSDDKIFDLLLSERGKQFDPILIDLFFSNLHKIEKIREKFKDNF